MNASPIQTLPGTEFPGYELVPTRAKAGLIVVHGVTDHSDRYRQAIDALARKGIACFAYDQQGHGRYPGVRTHVERFSDFVKDLESVGRSVQRRFPRLPLFVWGHSMGSLVVTLAAIDSLSWARGVIVTGCAVHAVPATPGALGAVVKAASALIPHLRIRLPRDATRLTQVEEIQRAYLNDPLVPKSASLRLLHELAAACRECLRQAPSIRKSWLAVHGEADLICPSSGSTALIQRLGSTDKQLVIYPELRHEIHLENERARSTLFDLMAGWIYERAVNHEQPQSHRPQLV